MISIDRISFEFGMNDELFAHSLYADWDSFCRTCFENIVEECLSAYDKDRMLHEIEILDLDLGSMPQEDFYLEFPRRLREELLKALPLLQPRQAEMAKMKTTASRLANLLYYLEYGALKTEWIDIGFNLSEELTGLMKQDKRYMKKIAGLCMANEYVLRRILWQTDNNASLVHLYSIAMDHQAFSVKDEKLRFLEIFLEMQPDVPVRFVHVTEKDGPLHGMAELLDSRSVRKIMEKEAEEHAEVDLPPYWHYLYEWLIKYYPYNGVAIFGGKSDFISHLHYRLLTFIRKRNNTFYLSKTELTASFLLEVFGEAHYKEVLNTICNMQPRNADGSPVYDGYYNRELYRIFIRLSLLYPPMDMDGNMDETASTENCSALLTNFRMEDLSSILKSTERSEADKKMIVATLVRQKPEELIGWLRSEAIRDKALIEVMAGWMGERKVVLLWIGGNRQNLSKQEMFKELLLLVYSEATGVNKEEIAMEELVMLLPHTDNDNQGGILPLTDLSALSILLKDTQRSEADKRMLIGMLVQEKPEAFISWLKSEATNGSDLMTVLAGLIDERTLKRLLASVSLAAMETVDKAIRYLTNLVKGKRLSDGLSYESFTLNARKAVLLWIKENGYVLSVNEGTKSLLQLAHKEATGKANEAMMEEWAKGLHLFKNEAKDLRIFAGQNDNERKDCIRRFRMILVSKNIAEVVKRRMVVSFLEQYKDNYADAILELHEEGLLEDAINLISLAATEAVIKQMVTRCIGASEAEKLLLLMNRLLSNENSVSARLKNKSLTLRTQVLVWLAKETKTQSGTVKPFMELFFLILTFLFGKENVSAVFRLIVYGMTSEVAADEMEDYDTLEVIDLFSYTGSSHVRHAMSVFEQWSQNIKAYSDTIQWLLQSRWNTSASFIEWMKDTGATTTEFKHELLQALAREKPQELIGLLRNLPQGEETVSLMAAHISTEALLDVAVKTNAKQTLLLSRTMNLLQREQGRFAFLSTITMSFTTALSEALLLFMQDNDTLGGRNLTEQEVIEIFLSKLYYVYTRKTDYNDHTEWKYLQDEVTNGLGLNGTETASISVSEETISERLLSEYSNLNDSELYTLISTLLDRQPEQFMGLFGNKANTDFIKRISDIADQAMLSHILLVLSFDNRFEHRAAFGRLVEWLSTVSVGHTSVSDIANALLSWISTGDWRRQTIRQMTLFFIARLYGSDDIANLSLEMLTDYTLPEEVRKRLLCDYMRSRPKELLDHIKRLTAEGRLPMDKWTEWANLSEWLQLVASMSLTLEELLRQVIEYLLYQNKSIDEMELRYGLTTFIATNDAAKFTYYVDKTEVIRTFVLSLPGIQKKTVEKKEEMVSQVMKNLGITSAEESVLKESGEDNSEIAFIGNAGLSLLSPWFPRLFTMLGYLDEEKRNFKDTASKIRAVFLLQYLACTEKKDCRETELVFNRLLVALPAHIPLPKQIELTDEEKQTADDMLEGVKANWPKMDGTSVSGFRQSFIMRDGRLEQQDEKWLLTVESRVYDILLDAVPWAFRQIRFPWLKKYVQVFWHEKQEF